MRPFSQLTPCFPPACLADWLVDRRHCNLKWQSQVLAIREKINAAIQDMPENEEIKQLLAGACEWSLGSGCPRRAETQAARVGIAPGACSQGFGYGNLPLGRGGDGESVTQPLLRPTVPGLGEGGTQQTSQ